MKKYFLIIFFVFLFFTESTKAQKIGYQFNASPLSLFDPTHPQFRAGTEICPFKFLYIGTDFGIGFTPNYKISFMSERDYKKYNFKQIRPTIKFVINRTETFDLYIGLEYFYMQENNIILDEYFFSKNHDVISFSEANYFRQKEGLHFLLGAKIFQVDNFIMDFYCGAGWARKYSTFSNLKNPVHNNYYIPMYFSSSGGSIFYGYLEVPHFTMNLKIAWQLDFSKLKEHKQ